MHISLNAWDITLIVIVSLQATILAYVYHPKWKAFMLSLPLPFTVAALAVGKPVDATNVAGLTLLLLFTHAVRLLHYHLRWPIIVSILASALGYCVIGSLLAPVIPSDETFFWVCNLATLALAAWLLKIMPARHEPGHRTPLPLWLKIPLIAAVILCIVLTKKSLQGFMTIFPMVGVIGAYEARHSLWTISRQIAVVMLTMVPLMAVSHLTEPRLGLELSLLVAWVAFLAVLAPLTRYMWVTQAAAEQAALRQSDEASQTAAPPNIKVATAI
jgi:hypothetical protein